jgi:hypothetical protein
MGRFFLVYFEAAREKRFGNLVADEVERKQGEEDSDQLFTASALDCER